MTDPNIYFTTPEGRRYCFAKAIIEQGGMSMIAAIVREDRGDDPGYEATEDGYAAMEADPHMSLDIPASPPNWL